MVLRHHQIGTNQRKSQLQLWLSAHGFSVSMRPAGVDPLPCPARVHGWADLGGGLPRRRVEVSMETLDCDSIAPRCPDVSASALRAQFARISWPFIQVRTGFCIALLV